MNGLLYLGTGALFIAWPGEVQTLFMEAPFVRARGSAHPCDRSDATWDEAAKPHDAMRNVTNFGSEKT